MFLSYNGSIIPFPTSASRICGTRPPTNASSSLRSSPSALNCGGCCRRRTRLGFSCALVCRRRTTERCIRSSEEYFLGRGVLNFQLGGEPFSVLITEALCFPQAYAAAIPVYAKLQQLPKAVIVDIGGFTADYLQIKYGQADLSVCDSLENGVIVLYNRVKSKINADFDMLLEESDIDAILQDKGRDMMKRSAGSSGSRRGFSSTTWPAGCGADDRPAFRQDGFRRRRFHPAEREQIEACGKAGPALFVDELAANTKGYELLYRASKFGG